MCVYKAAATLNSTENKLKRLSVRLTWSRKEEKTTNENKYRENFWKLVFAWYDSLCLLLYRFYRTNKTKPRKSKQTREFWVLQVICNVFLWCSYLLFDLVLHSSFHLRPIYAAQFCRFTNNCTEYTYGWMQDQKSWNICLIFRNKESSKDFIAGIRILWIRLNFQANKSMFCERFGFDNHKIYARKTISVALPIHSTVCSSMQNNTIAFFNY